jgi:hypothetical protein
MREGKEMQSGNLGVSGQREEVMADSGDTENREDGEGRERKDQCRRERRRRAA